MRAKLEARRQLVEETAASEASDLEQPAPVAAGAMPGGDDDDALLDAIFAGVGLSADLDAGADASALPEQVLPPPPVTTAAVAQGSMKPSAALPNEAAIGQPPSVSRGASEAGKAAEQAGCQVFRLNSPESPEKVPAGGALIDIPTMPAAPQAPADFSEEDLRLRGALIELYSERNPGNVPRANDIVAQHRGGAPATELWVQLGLKYDLAAWRVVELLARTLYLERSHKEQLSLELSAEELVARAASLGSDAEGFLRTALLDGKHAVAGWRPTVWKVLLGCLPMAQRDQWRPYEQALYARSQQEFAAPSETEGASEDACQGSGAGAVGAAQLEDIRNDVASLAHLDAPARKALESLLLTYAKLNPAVGYAHGMHEVGAAVIHAVGAASAANAEMDALWCFTALMQRLKDRFLQGTEANAAAVQGFVGTDESLLSKYDPELARHLEAHELEPGIFALRWSTLLFARDLEVADLLRVWDVLIAQPPQPGPKLAGCLCTALVMACRERLLSTSNVMDMAEVLQSAPRDHLAGFRGASPDLQVGQGVAGAAAALCVRRALALRALEQRPQQPPFPPLAAAALVQQMAGAFFHGLVNRF